MNGDLISREALKKEIDTWGCNDFDKYDFLEAIDNAPTVNYSFYQEAYQTGYEEGHKEGYKQAIIDGKTNYSRPQGEWIGINRDCRGYCDTFKCSICGAYIYPYTVVKELDYNGCPYCFADMRGAE